MVFHWNLSDSNYYYYYYYSQFLSLRLEGCYNEAFRLFGIVCNVVEVKAKKGSVENREGCEGMTRHDADETLPRWVTKNTSYKLSAALV